MNLKYVLITLTIIWAHTSTQLFAPSMRYVEKTACENEEDCKDMNNSCQCYCSVKCGYRDKDQDKDNPVYVEKGIQIGNELVHCFCKQDDLDDVQIGVCVDGKISPRRMK